MSNVRPLLLIAGLTLSVSGCLLPSHRALEERTRFLRTVTFDSATDLVTIPARYATNAGPSVLAHVVEIGGRIDDSHGDTLVIEPIYVVTSDPDHSGERRYESAAEGFALPDRVVVIVNAGARIEDFHRRGNTPAWVSLVLLFSVLAYFVGSGLYNLHHHKT